MNPRTVRAEMARHGLLPNQLRPYWSPDRERTIDPLMEEDTRVAVRDFARWLEQTCLDSERHPGRDG